MMHKALIITHFFATGPTQELRDYLKERVEALLFIQHPFSYCVDTRSSMVFYECGIESRKRRFLKFRGPDLLFYVKDFLLNIIYVIISGGRFDIAIAADNLNALSAIFLKKIGIVKWVVYFTIDYTPVRFKNRLLNSIYHWIDRVCCYNSDLIWNDSRLMEIARRENGVDAKRTAPQIVVTGGNHFSRIKRLPIGEIERHTIVYMGHVLKKQGLDLVVESMPELIKKVSDLKFMIIGSGDYLESLKKKAVGLDLSEYIEFKGYIKELSDVEEILSRCAIGVATYLPDTTSVTFFSDSGKPRIYMACGLPIIITKVSDLANDVMARKTGIAIDYKKEEFIEAVSRLLTDDTLYKEYRKNAIEFASGFDWGVIFENAFNKSFNCNQRQLPLMKG